MIDRHVREWRDGDLATFKHRIVPLNEPAVLKGLLKDWPAVQAGLSSNRALCDYSLPHGFLTLRHLPSNQRAARRAVFDHYVFQMEADPVAHLPPELAEHIRNALLKRLNRN